ncbi:hypothetical protein D7S78_24335 [Ralstonia pickettii]|nr:hypothetical protein [Ralstonia pickettii]MBA9913577.1 hypothetical protein [Ralstonia insidiosa]MBA9894780.1 hypothetical protein [Ralstonia pickettii]MBA9926815.1 hypothetical protein [Ralstonia pickettii]MBA9952711.1 hypothetical protein [Ralstonia insidiosa]
MCVRAPNCTFRKVGGRITMTNFAVDISCCGRASYS